MSERTNESVTRTNAVCNANQGNHAVLSAVRSWAVFMVGPRVHTLSALRRPSVSSVLYGLPLSDPEILLSLVFVQFYIIVF